MGQKICYLYSTTSRAEYAGLSKFYCMSKNQFLTIDELCTYLLNNTMVLSLALFSFTVQCSTYFVVNNDPPRFKL